MATFWDALIWWWDGRMQQAPVPAMNQQGGQGQQQVVPMGQILPQAPGVDGGNQNFLIFAFQEIVNYSPNIQQVAMTLFMVQCFCVVVLFTAWGLWKTIRKLYKYFRNLFFLIRARFRGVDLAGDFVNERMSGNERNGETRINENTRASPPPAYSSIYQVNHDAAEAVAASILGPNRTTVTTREATPQRENLMTTSMNNRAILPQGVAPELFKKTTDVRAWLGKFDYYLEAQGVSDKIGTLRAFLDTECAELMQYAIPWVRL